VAAFLGVALPFALMASAALMSPPPYVLTGTPVAAEWFAGGDGATAGTRIVVKRLRDPGQAVRWAKYRLREIDPSYSSEDFSGASWYHGEDGAAAGAILPVANLVVEITGSSATAVEGALKSLDFVGENPQKGLAWVLENRLGALGAALFAYLVAVGLALARLGSWAATVSPDRATAPAAEAELRRRLLAVNEEDAPFTVAPWKGGRMRVEWRLADARWTHLLQKNRVLKVERLTLALDGRSHKARVVESSMSTRGSAGLSGLLASFGGWMGIRFYGADMAKEYGLAYEPGRGWRLDKAYEYRFSAAELKAPFLAAVTESGWTWKPVMTLVRPLGG
jgi:hypothetical protein